MARVRRSKNGIPQQVTARTAARRARKIAAAKAEASRDDRTTPETLGQARVWERKRKRYEIVGLCYRDAAAAAWGHAAGFQRITDPCAECQPIIDNFPTPGPKGSKWRKLLIKAEYFDEVQLGALLDVLWDD